MSKTDVSQPSSLSKMSVMLTQKPFCLFIPSSSTAFVNLKLSIGLLYLLKGFPVSVPDSLPLAQHYAINQGQGTCSSKKKIYWNLSLLERLLRNLPLAGPNLRYIWIHAVLPLFCIRDKTLNNQFIKNQIYLSCMTILSLFGIDSPLAGTHTF